MGRKRRRADRDQRPRAISASILKTSDAAPAGAARAGLPRVACGRAFVTPTADGLLLEAPPAPHRGWTIAAVVYGVPWLAAVLVATVWYLGWGFPDDFFVRILVWVVVLLLTAAMHAIALLGIWGSVYARSGTETMVIDRDAITVIRQAGRVPIRMHIRRNIVERASLLPAPGGSSPHPRIEVKAWRSAIRFGAGLDAEEAETLTAAINELFERDEAVRHALTPEDADVTIAPTRADGSARMTLAMTGTSTTADGLMKRAGTVGARVVRRFRKSPPSLGPNGRTAK